ncbi:hypothetical protein LP419_38445 [Massilia sp. H-1]|nr:hypothetical protein LP419_38445 [Massilia sp. H-1]
MQAHPLTWHLGNLALALALPGLGWADYQFGSEVRLTAFFLIPIILLTWRLGAFAGYLSGIAAFIVLVTVRMSQFSDDGDHLLLTADLLGRFLAFFLIVVICSRLHAAYRLQRHIATHDGLSGLLSRSGLLLQLDAQAAGRAVRDAVHRLRPLQGHE